MLLIACLFAAVAALPQTLPQQPSASTTSSTPAQREKELDTVFSDYWEQRLKDSPEFASTLGDKRYDDQLSDYSVAGYNAHLERDRAFLDRLGAIDDAGLPQQEQLSKDLLVRKLVDEQEEARFKPWEMPVNQFHGLHLELPQLVPQLSFDTADDYDHYVTRLGKVPTAFAQITDDMMTGMDDGQEPPKYLLEKVLVQVNTLTQQKPEDSPFALPLKKFPASISPAQQPEIRQQVLKAIATQVLPAYARFGRFLSAQYIPHGRTEPGIWSLPDGDAYYKFLVRRSTTTDLTPDAIHKIGEQLVAEDETEMTAIAKKLGFADLKSLRASIPNNPKLHATSPEALIAVYRGYLDGMKPKLPQLFGRLPKAPLEVQAVPAYMAKDQPPAYYQHGTPDGKRPGIFFVNTYDYAHRPSTMAETVAYHEGLPGHHLQISIAQELTGIPEFRKHNYYTAYTEGWGLYAERLGKDVGFYTDPYSDYGRLEGDEWRAIRLVVDTGVHSEHWSRQQMVDYFHAHSSIAETDVQAEVDRYIAWPAQALGYKIGQLKFLELRAQAQQALGPKFDIRGFHDTILDSGALPLDVVEQRVDAWIASQQSGKAQ
ncbi:MAG TPA: DUF885 domain-containing protein [Acidobacteriaceae bacterium]|jgi:uncharacterized protein (DUF885 family)